MQGDQTEVTQTIVGGLSFNYWWGVITVLVISLAVAYTTLSTPSAERDRPNEAPMRVAEPPTSEAVHPIATRADHFYAQGETETGYIYSWGNYIDSGSDLIEVETAQNAMDLARPARATVTAEMWPIAEDGTIMGRAMMDETVRYRKVTQQTRLSRYYPDKALIEGFIAECRSMTAGSSQDCLIYAIELASPISPK